MIKRIFTLFVAVIFTLSIVSCSSDETKYTYCELTIDLPDDFYSVKNDDFDVVYSNGEYMTAILRISFQAAVMENIPETLTPYEFGEFWIEKCQRDATLIKENSVYCEYFDYDEKNDNEYFYHESFYRSAYAYFVILFAVDSELCDTGRVDFLKYSESVKFTLYSEGEK